MAENSISELAQQLKYISEDVKVIKEIVTGNGDPSKGFVVRLDRLEQQAQSNRGLRDKVLNAIIAALVAAGFSAFGPHK